MDEYFIDNDVLFSESKYKRIKIEDITREQIYFTIMYNPRMMPEIKKIIVRRGFNLNTDIEPLNVVNYREPSFVMAALGYLEKSAIDNTLWMLDHGANITLYTWALILTNPHILRFKDTQEYEDLVIKYIELGADPSLIDFNDVNDGLLKKLNVLFRKQALAQAIPLLEAGYPYMTVCQIMDEAYYNGFSSHVCNDIYKLAVKIGKLEKNKYHLYGE